MHPILSAPLPSSLLLLVSLYTVHQKQLILQHPHHLHPSISESVHTLSFLSAECLHKLPHYHLVFSSRLFFQLSPPLFVFVPLLSVWTGLPVGVSVCWRASLVIS